MTAQHPQHRHAERSQGQQFDDDHRILQQFARGCVKTVSCPADHNQDNRQRVCWQKVRTNSIRQRIAFERNGRRGDRPAESSRQRYPAAQKAGRRVDVPTQIQIFATRFRHQTGQSTVRDRSTGSNHTTQTPTQHDAKRRTNRVQRKSGSRENAGSDHAGDDQKCQRSQSINRMLVVAVVSGLHTRPFSYQLTIQWMVRRAPG